MRCLPGTWETISWRRKIVRENRHGRITEAQGANKNGTVGSKHAAPSTASEFVKHGEYWILNTLANVNLTNSLLSVLLDTLKATLDSNGTSSDYRVSRPVSRTDGDIFAADQPMTTFIIFSAISCISFQGIGSRISACCSRG